MIDIYLAAPYSHPDARKRDKRVLMVNRMALKLMRMGITVFSPLTGSHELFLMSELDDDPTPLSGDFEYWEVYDRAILGVCQALVIYNLPGWYESRGVTSEIEIAKQMGKPVYESVEEYLEVRGNG